MPRRRPSALRADRMTHAPHRGRYSRIGRLSGPAQAQIIRLERTRLQPGVVGQALAWWTAVARFPDRRWDEGDGPFGGRCGWSGCCPDPTLHRDLLQLAIHALPVKSARELRRVVRELDDRILSRPGLTPTGPVEGVWWRDVI